MAAPRCALIGHSGFVGSALMRQVSFSHRYNSANFRDLKDQEFERVVCAGLPAAKWVVNQNPDADYANMRALMSVLETVRVKRFILISTIDVYPNPGAGADEAFDCHSSENHPYGRHRLEFEDFIRQTFPSCLIVRLPGLFGEGLKKNIIFDLLHDNCLESINPDSRFQWYDISNLWQDIERIDPEAIQLVNFMPEPVDTQSVLARCFAGVEVGSDPSPTAAYDIRTGNASLFDRNDVYIASAEEVLAGIQRYVEWYRGQS